MGAFCDIVLNICMFACFFLRLKKKKRINANYTAEKPFVTVSILQNHKRSAYIYMLIMYGSKTKMQNLKEIMLSASPHMSPVPTFSSLPF